MIRYILGYLDVGFIVVVLNYLLARQFDKEGAKELEEVMRTGGLAYRLGVFTALILQLFAWPIAALNATLAIAILIDKKLRS